jgi:hypothetical protein
MGISNRSDHDDRDRSRSIHVTAGMTKWNGNSSSEHRSSRSAGFPFPHALRIARFSPEIHATADADGRTITTVGADGKFSGGAIRTFPQAGSAGSLSSLGTPADDGNLMPGTATDVQGEIVDDESCPGADNNETQKDLQWSAGWMRSRGGMMQGRTKSRPTHVSYVESAGGRREDHAIN